MDHMDDVQSVTMGIQTRIGRHHTSVMKKSILRRKSVLKDLNKEILEWQVKDQGEGDEQGHNAGAISMNNPTVYRSHMHQFLSWVTNTSYFENFIMLTIFINAIIIAVETSSAPGSNGDFFVVADIIFLVIYTIEFALKVFCEPRDYWASNYNRFDFLILFLSLFSFMQLIMKSDSGIFSNLAYIRVLRALRALRALRSISFIRALRVLVNALIKTLWSIINLLAVLLLIMYVFAIMGFYFFGPGESETHASADQWGSIDTTMFILFDYVTADGWTQFSSELDDRGLKLARFYTVTFIFIGHFIFTNLFIGVIINNLHEAQEEEALYQKVKRDAIIEAKKDILLARQGQELEVIDEIEKVPIQTIISQLAGKLRHDDFVPMTHLSCNLDWVESYLTTMTHQQKTMHTIQQLHFNIANMLAEIVEVRYARSMR